MPRRWFRIGFRLALFASSLSFMALAATPDATPAQALAEMHRKLAEPLANSPLRRPVHLVSAETPGGLQGDVYAVVDYPIDDVRRALENPAQWCDMLTLHINNRRCRVARKPGGDTVTLSVVRRYDKPVEQAFELAFVHHVASATKDYLAVDLSAETGPMGTSHYRVTLEAVPLGERQSFLHFGYAYDHNMMARFATMAYLATFGSRKVGFTVIGKTASGEPDYIRGLRGLMERNAMRYFFALDAYLAGLDVPPAQQADTRLTRWFNLVEEYPTQLHEAELAAYLAVKREDRDREASAKR
jgi:hypothetical protein